MYAHDLCILNMIKDSIEHFNVILSLMGQLQMDQTGEILCRYR